ncbi:MAG: leucine-rich repeat protein [Clostridia bacterium]|nr:leucine-rich repeat protein [Clostridia bacterium]
MKIRTRKTAIRVCSVAFAAMLASGFALFDRQSAQNYISSAQSAGGFTVTDVSGKYSTAGIRSEYMNGDVVSANVSVKNEERWVVVDLGGTSLMDEYEKTSYSATFPDFANTTAAQNLKAKIERNNGAFLNRLSASGVKYEYKYSYSTLLNGVAIKIKNADVAAVKAMGEVKDVYSSESYLAPTVAVSNDANVYTTGIYNTTGIEQQGQGMVVSILDTGLDYTHPAFNEKAPSAPAMKKEEMNLEGLEILKRDSSLTVDDVYINSKVPFAYDYADDDTDVYPAYSTHGTHVAGIVAGQDSTKIVNNETKEKFIGVAPEAQLVICKVFTDDLESKALGGANSIDILAAISDSVALGVDIINMSLGQSVGFSEEGYATAGDWLSKCYERAEEAGVSVVCAASNDYSSAYGGAYGTNLTSNPDSGTVGSPSTFDGALSVAAISGQASKYFAINGDENKVAFITESADANGKAYNFLDGLYDKLGVDKSESLTLNYVVVGGVGRSNNYTQQVKNALRDGKTIAVVKRGEISFADKVQYAQNAGAVGCIVYNNLSGNIRMSLGEVNNPIPTCSVNMDAGKLLVDSAKSSRGTITLSYDRSAGPFMSDFSSWGPTPDLKLKPEITAHGGEITSSVPGGYAVMSGTSMAAPNMSGATTLLRQYVKETYPELKGKELNDRVNQLLMSTATMAKNEEGNPYSPRKQGAGLASILNAINTNAYLTAENNYLGENSTKDPKPKIELGDDPNKTGVYEFSFTVNNVSDHAITYNPEVYVMTESLSTDLRTVAEKAYMLTDNCNITVPKSVTVPANGTVTVEVKIELNKTAKDYLDRTFENGMFVEGYVRLNKTDENEVSLGIPYLAFYGDWMKAPLFDYSIYEVEASDADKSLEEDEKLKASSNASRPYGLYYDQRYIITLGSYLYDMAPNYTDILPSDERAAISCYDEEGKRTVYELFSLNAGLLRSAKEMEIVISDAATGEVVYRHTEENVRKSYSAGGSNFGTNIGLRIDPLTWNLSNNKTYTATFTGKLDYDGTGSTDRSSYSFNFTIDTEAPQLLDVRLRYEPYEENEVTKYRIYLDADVYDNQYAMTLMPCYLDETRFDENGNPQLALLSEFPVPIYSQKGGITTVTYEVTDCFEDYLVGGENGSNFYLSLQDYALNEITLQITYTDATRYPDSLTLQTDEKLVSVSAESSDYPVYSLSLNRYESYTVEAASGLPSGTAITALNFDAQNGYVACKENQIFAAEAGSGTVLVQTVQFVQDGDNRKEIRTTLAQINVTVNAGSASAPIMERILLSPMLDGDGYLQPFKGEIHLKPNTTRQIQANVQPWYSAIVHQPEYEYKSSDETVLTVSDTGLITTYKKGYASVTVSIKGNNVVPPSQVTVTVDEELSITNNVLYHYYGGKICEIPNNKNVLSIDKEAFRNNKLVEEIYLPISVTSLPEDCFQDCVNLRKIVIPAECTVIHQNAFKGCTALEEIVFVEAEDEITKQPYPGTITIGMSAFAGCTSLTKISNQKRITSAYDYAFAGCTALEEIDISGLRTGGDHIFDGCEKLTTVTMSSLTHVGKYMFRGCEKLEGIEYYSDVIPDYAFAGCKLLDEFTYSGETLRYFGAYAFANTAIEEFTLPGGTYTVGAHAFDGSGLKKLTFSQNTDVSFGASVFAGCDTVSFDGANVVDGMLVKDDTLVLAPAASGAVTLPSGIKKIGAGAFAGTEITSIDLSGVTEIGEYAFAESMLQSVSLDIANIPKGAFQGCTSLRTVTFSNAVVSIGDYAFANCSDLMNNLSLPAVKSVGAFAFYCTPVEGLTANALESIGAYAFYGHNFQSNVKDRAVIVLPALHEVGSFAFARNLDYKGFESNYGSALTSVELGAVTKMGEHVFADCPITTAKFAEGTTQIGAFAFVSSQVTRASIYVESPSANTRLTSVTLPNTVKTIGDYAFLNATNLRSANLDLSGVESIGTGAFWLCAGITSLDLSNVLTIGDYAFDGSGITEANLQKATNIGSYAFAESKLSTLNMPVMKRIGPYAFAATLLTSVEIPATLPLTYEDKWGQLDDFGVVNPRAGRYFYAFGENAFAAVSALRTITVAEGNDAYFVDEYGVLYGILSGTKEEGAYVLLQYPVGKDSYEDGYSYAILKNTVRIGDGAFYGAVVTRDDGTVLSSLDLKEIRIPATVKSIGSFAFYNCAAEKYIFEGTTAPILEATYSVPGYGSDQVFNQIIDLMARFGIYYSNFYSYVAFSVIGGADYGLTIEYPENGKGYDNLIWSGFFSNQVPVKAPTDDDKHSGSGLSAGAIAGICIGCAAALGGAAAAAIILVRKRKKA